MTRTLSLLVGLAALAAAAPADAKNLLYGRAYTLENLFSRTGIGNGGFLDVKGSGCEGNFRCVETSVGQTRSGGSTTWMLLSATGKPAGSAVTAGDDVYLFNVDDGNGGYLDVNGAGCWGDNRCVSTAHTPTRSGYSGRWKLQRDDINTSANLYEGQALHLLSMADASAGYLDVTGYCRDNAYVNGLGANNYRCVATSPGWNRDQNSTHWAFAAAPTATGAGWCISTNDVGWGELLFDNGVAALVFNQGGNLVFSNTGGNGTSAEGIPVGGSWDQWGTGSGTALHGSNAAHLCLGDDGDLRLTDGAGNLVWQSFAEGQAPTTDNLLLLDDCTLSITGTDASGQRVTTWSTSTAQCEEHQRYAGIRQLHGGDLAAPRCWDAGEASQRIVWDTQTGLEVYWQDGLLRMHETGGLHRLWWAPWIANYDTPAYDATRAFQLCQRTDGTLAVYDSADNVLWTHGAASTHVAIDAGGFGYWDDHGTEVARADSFLNYTKRAHTVLDPDPLSQPYTDIATSGPGWCLGPDVSQVIVSKADEARLVWDRGTLSIQLNPSFLSSAWHQTVPGGTLCFQNDGNLVIYDALGNAPWASNTNNASSGVSPNVLVVEGTQVTMVDQTRAQTCNDFNTCVARYTGDNPILHCADDNSVEFTGMMNQCETTDWYTVWDPAAQAGVSQFAAGGFSFFKDSKVGDDNFGAESWIGAAACSKASVTALEDVAHRDDNEYMADRVDDVVSASPADDYTMVMVDAGVQLTLFGYTPDDPVVEAYGVVEGENGAASGEVEIDVGGLAVYTRSADTQSVGTSYEYSIDDIVHQSATFYVGVPVEVEGSVSGSAGVEITGGISLSTFTASIIPFVGFDGTLSAGVGAGVGDVDVSVGVEGTVSFIHASIPFTNTLTFSGSKGYDESARFEATSLDGDVSVYAEAGPLSWSKEIASWDGITLAQQTLYHVSGGL